MLDEACSRVASESFIGGSRLARQLLRDHRVYPHFARCVGGLGLHCAHRAFIPVSPYRRQPGTLHISFLEEAAEWNSADPTGVSMPFQCLHSDLSQLPLKWPEMTNSRMPRNGKCTHCFSHSMPGSSTRQAHKPGAGPNNSTDYTVPNTPGTHRPWLQIRGTEGRLSGNGFQHVGPRKSFG